MGAKMRAAAADNHSSNRSFAALAGLSRSLVYQSMFGIAALLARRVAKICGRSPTQLDGFRQHFFHGAKNSSKFGRP